MANKLKHTKNSIKPVGTNVKAIQQDSEDINADQLTLIVENTDNVDAPKPGNGLFESRKNRIEASLGSNNDLVSVVVQSYNRLDKTKNCIESIQMHRFFVLQNKEQFT